MRMLKFEIALVLFLAMSFVAVAQSASQLTATRTFSPVLSGTTDVLDPLATSFEVTITFTDENPDPLGSLPITALGFKENAMPTGWTYGGIVATPSGASPSGGDFNDGWFWVFAPPMPLSFTYRLNVAAPLASDFVFDGLISVANLGPVNIFPAATQTLLVPSVGGEGEGEGEGEGQPPTSSADQNGDGMVDLPELLRVIQFFNIGTLHCDPAGEDGYSPGIGDVSCAPHSSDYDPQDWNIGLTEVLRLIQFFNMLGYYPCPSGEDGFCPGTPL